MGTLYVLKSRSQKLPSAAEDNAIIELWEIA